MREKCWLSVTSLLSEPADAAFLGIPSKLFRVLAGDECALLLCGSEGGRVRIVLDYVCVKGRVYHDMRLYTKVTWTSCPCVHV